MSTTTEPITRHAQQVEKARGYELGPDHPDRRKSGESSRRLTSRTVKWPNATARPPSFAVTAFS